MSEGRPRGKSTRAPHGSLPGGPSKWTKESGLREPAMLLAFRFSKQESMKSSTPAKNSILLVAKEPFPRRNPILFLTVE